MFYIIIAVLCSVCVSILLKLLRNRDNDIRQTIVAGYPVAFLLTWFLLKPDISQIDTLNVNAWLIIGFLGILLPLVFVILGRAIESVGIIATDAAQRLSLILPIVVSFLLFGEMLTPLRLFGIALGFMALAALVYRQPISSTSDHLIQSSHPNLNLHNDLSSNASLKSKLPIALWLLGVWLGYGVIDILFKQVAKQGAGFSLTLFLSFGLAALLLFIYLLIKQIHWQSKALASGLILGVLNIGNIYAYIKAHQTLADSPSVVFTGMNVGVITVATLVGAIVFKERLSKVNVLGIVLALACFITLVISTYYANG